MGDTAVNTQYDAIAREYQATKQSPLRRHIEAYTFFDLLGELRGLDVLDLACGEGFYTRLIKEAGAARVVGVDISAEMIALARQLEAQQPLGIEYAVGDAATWLSPSRFDVVSAAYLLHYAPDRAALEAMCANIVAALKPGGRLVCINENPLQTFAQHAGYAQYGFNKHGAEPQRDGARIQYSMVSGRQMISFGVFHYERSTYEAALRQAGFRSVSWESLRLSPDAEAEMGADYWREYLDNPPITGLVCAL